MKLQDKLNKLIQSGQIKSFLYEEEVPSYPGDTESRLVDKLTIEFPNGEKIKLSTFCSGSRENTCIYLKQD